MAASKPAELYHHPPTVPRTARCTMLDPPPLSVWLVVLFCSVFCVLLGFGLGLIMRRRGRTGFSGHTSMHLARCLPASVLCSVFCVLCSALNTYISPGVVVALDGSRPSIYTSVHPPSHPPSFPLR